MKSKAFALRLGGRRSDVPNRKKKWTQEEIDYLESAWADHGPDVIGRKLQRTKNAVMVKAVELGLGSRLSQIDGISARALFGAICSRRNTDYIRFFARRGLHFRHMRHDGKGAKGTAYISIDEFWKWAESHVGDIELDVFTPGTLGPEPDWMREARAANPSRRPRLAWTDEEDRDLLRQVRLGVYTERELARMHGRSACAIRTRLQVLNCPLRPLPVQNERRMWSAEEEERAREMMRGGWCTSAIARELNRNESAVFAKLKRMRMEEKAG